MTNESTKPQNNNSVLVYQITVNGVLDENWADCFNGLPVSLEAQNGEAPTTLLTCRVRDQAELNGILNWLHNMNLKLVQVKMYQKEVKDD